MQAMREAVKIWITNEKKSFTLTPELSISLINRLSKNTRPNIRSKEAH